MSAVLLTGVTPNEGIPKRLQRWNALSARHVVTECVTSVKSAADNFLYSLKYMKIEIYIYIVSLGINIIVADFF